MKKIDKVVTSHKCEFLGFWCFLQLFENKSQKNVYKNYHVCKVIVVLHYYNNSFGFK